MIDILHLPEKEPFVAGIDVPVQFPLGELRKLENVTIMLVNKGTVRIEVDFCEYVLGEDSRMSFGFGEFFQCLEISPDFTVSYCTFQKEILLEITTPFDYSFFAFRKKYPLTIPKEWEQKKGALLQLMYRLYLEREHTFRLPMFKNLLQTYLMDLYDKTKAQFIDHRLANTNRKEELFEKFIALVYEYSSTRRDVQFYADQLCVSARYLSAIVQSLTRHSPKEVIDTRCIQEIKMLLRTTNEPMQEIAFRLDFPDQSFFTRYFKKHTGMTPAEFRGKN